MNFIQSLKESIGGYYRNLVSSYVRRLHSHLEVLEGRVSGLYAHLESRGVPMPTDESGNPLPKDTAHLLPTLRHLDSRKVECYETDGIEDGQSLGSALMGDHTKITKLIDHSDYDMIRGIPSTLSSLTEVELGQVVMDGRWFQVLAIPSVTELRMPNLRVFSGVHGGTWANMHLISGTSIRSLTLPNLEELHTSHTMNGFIINNSTITEMYFPKLWDVRSCSDNWGYKYLLYTSSAFVNCSALKKLVTAIDTVGNFRTDNNFIKNCPNIEVFVVGKLKSWSRYMTAGMPKLLHFEVGEGTAISFSLEDWSPTLDSSTLSEFQSNFHEYIAKRLATFPDTGSHPTLTLSQTVRDAITQQSEDLIVATKHWSLAPARTQV